MREIIVGIVISVVATTLVSVGGYFIYLIRKENKHRFDKLEHRLNALSTTDHKNKEDNRVVIQTLFAVLDGLIQMGANGMVNETRDELRQHLIDHNE